jgi:hypothetical protein
MPIIFRFARPHYVSDATQFIEHLKAEEPPDEIAREDLARVSQTPYVYTGPLPAKPDA